jgi:DNA repair protein RadC
MNAPPITSPTPAGGVSPVNYTVRVVRFAVVREPAAPQPRTLSEPDAVVTLARALIPDDAREHFGILLLSTRHGLIAYHEVSTGTLSASLVHPREVFGPALRMLGVASLILVHNHPSGDPTPSQEDIRLTRQLVEGAKVFDLPIHDHVILGNGTSEYVSLASRGLL